MRRYRPIHHSLAFLVVSLGVAGGPAVALADDGAGPAEPTEGTTPTPQPAAPNPAPVEDDRAPATTTAPTVPATTEPVTTETPVTTTTDAPAAPETTAAAPAPAPDAAAPDATSTTSTTVPTPPPPATDAETATTPRPTVPASAADDEDDELDVDVTAALPDERVVRPIAFPVLGTVSYGNDWGNCRDGCARRHQGTDMIGVRMQPLLAAVDGTVTRIRHEDVGTAGSVISITGADGWYYNYFHVNNDTPGSDDGRAEPAWQISPDLTIGSTVRAGQVIGYMGDSGNAEGSVAHLHFEIRRPDRTPVNPYHSLVAAQRRETCEPSGGLALTDPADLSPAAIAVIPLDGGGHWLIDRDGRLFADGTAARVAPVGGVECSPAPAPVVMAAPAPVVLAASAPLDAPEVAPPAAPSTEVAPPPAPAPMTWTVERGQSLWQIAQDAYGVSDVATTVSLVDLLVEHNRDVISDPDVIQVGMTLLLPPQA